MPVRRVTSTSAACISPAAPPSSAKPELMISAFLTPARAHSSNAGATPAAGIATSARSTCLTHGADRGVAAQPLDLLIAGIDRQDAAGKTVLAQLVQQAPADAMGVGRGAQYRDRLRPEEAL